MDNFVLAVFTLEIVVKVVAQGTRPLRFFRENWNKFDFFIVFACFFFMIPVFPNVSSMLSMLRLLRLLRVLKLVKALPELRIIIEALISGFGSITFVTIILCIFFYIYANIGMLIFAENDPANFGNLQLAMVALFRSATLDGWSDIMCVQ
jgi:voltage-gated sodium channel